MGRGHCCNEISLYIRTFQRWGDLEISETLGGSAELQDPSADAPAGRPQSLGSGPGAEDAAQNLLHPALGRLFS